MCPTSKIIFKCIESRGAIRFQLAKLFGERGEINYITSAQLIKFVLVQVYQ